MRALFTTLACFGCVILQAQFTKPEHQVTLVSGDVYKGEHLIYETPIMQTPYFSLGDETFETSTVAFFQNNHGYFANLGRLHGVNSERYAMRIQHGKIDLYEEIELSVYGGDDLKTEGTGNNQDPMLATGMMLEYYRKGDQAIRKASYGNLKVDLSDNEMSMRHLKRYRNYKILQWGLVGLGSGIVASSIMAQSHQAVRFNPMMALGIVIGGGSYLLESPKQDELWLAADEYNKEEEILSER